MRPADVRNLIRFNTRMSMFICPLDRTNVVSFLHGYEYCSGGECRFTEALGGHLAKRHRIKPNALSWSDQIARLAEKRALDWMDIYLLISSEVLHNALQSPEPGGEP